MPHHDPVLGADVLGPGVMPVLTGTPGAVRWAGAAEPGTHNTEVYADLLGLSEAEMRTLAEFGVI